MKPRRVLIAYPDDAQIGSLSTLFQRRGYRIEMAKMVSDIIRKIRTNNIHVILLDDEVEGIKACDLVSLIKKISPKVQIIVTSSEASVGLLKRLRGAGIFYQAMKPFDLDEIGAAVECAFDKVERECFKEGFLSFFIPKLVPA
jgi:DNA-binding NtrC family response regulator